MAIEGTVPALSDQAATLCRHSPAWGDGLAVSVLILNWNGLSYLIPCLSSVFQDACPHVEVILVDNGSSDESVRLAQRNFPRLRIIAHPKNLGYSEGYNRAIDAVSGRFIVFLNNDTVVGSGWLTPLIDELLDPRVGLTTSKLVLLNTRVIQATGGQLKLWQGSMELGFGMDDELLGSRRVVRPFYAVGAAMAISADLFRRLAGFDERLSLYCEDLDLSWRARLEGHTILCTTESVVYHHLSASSGVLSPVKLRLVTAHYFAVMIKCLSTGHLLHSLPAYTLFAFLKGSALAILESNPRYLFSVLLAFRDTVQAFGEILHQRQDTQKRRVAPDRVVLRSEGFGLFESPLGMLRFLRQIRRLSRRDITADDVEPAFPNATSDK